MDKQDVDPEIAGALAGLPDDFASFGHVFETVLRPKLLEMETSRQAAAKKAKQGYLYGGLIAAAGILVAVLLMREPAVAIISALAGLGTSGFMGSNLRQIGKQAKAMMVVPIAKEFGLEFLEHPGDQHGIHDFHNARLVPRWDRSNYEDKIIGQRNGVDFEFFEAHLEQRRTTRDSQGRTRTKWVTVFRGQCLRFDFHKTFHGRTLVARDAGIFNRFGGGDGMKIAKLEDPKFEKAFSVYTTDQVESRFILTPDFMQRLVDLEEAFRGANLRCAFVDGEMQVAIENGDMFEPGSLFVPLDNPERVRELLDDFASVFKLIDSTSSPDN